MLRDFTYVDDVVDGVVRTMDRPPARKPHNEDVNTASSYYRIYNIGNNKPVELTKLIQVPEDKIRRKAIIKWSPMQPGDVPVTSADIDELSSAVGYRANTSIEEGVSRFVDWYREYY
jgi:UDP-glucuronate 4-epimerase